jgi:4,5-dihydroxyphthalate decarboxylase
MNQGGVIEVQGGDYEHVLEFQGAGLDYRRVALVPLAKLVLGGGGFHAAEWSLASHIMLHARGETRLTAIPVFPTRAFRNAAVYVSRDSPLHDLGELKGRRVGITEFAMTTAVWTRGHIQDAHGIDVADVEWVVGPDQRFPLSEHIRSEQTEQNLEELLAAGRIDALMAGKPKDLQRPPAERRLRPLVADAEALERAWFAETSLYPIMHTVVLHPDVQADAGLPRRVFDAYALAKRKALARRLSAGFLPFAERVWDRFAAADPCQYGLTTANRRNIATLSRYLRAQGLIDHEPAIDDLFVAGAADWSDT